MEDDVRRIEHCERLDLALEQRERARVHGGGVHGLPDAVRRGERVEHEAHGAEVPGPEDLVFNSFLVKSSRIFSEMN